MVRLCVAGGGLSDQRLEQAERLCAQGNLAEAATLYREVLKHSPQDPNALMMLGVIAQQAGNSPLALQLIESALALQPDFARAWFNRSIVLRILGREDEALRSAQMAADADPNLAEAWDIIGQIFKNRRDFLNAAVAHKHALTLQPRDPHFQVNYACFLLATGDLSNAYQFAQKARKIDPNYPPMILGNILRAMGHSDLAADLFAKARNQNFHPEETSASEAMARLQMGEWEQGWALWEQRPDLEPVLGTIPFWRGQKIPHLLLYEDQGLGDTIQFLHFIPLLKNIAERLTLLIKSPLHSLCVENFPDIFLIEDKSKIPAVNARCRLSSLPALFPQKIDELTTPYLFANQGRRSFYQNKLEKLPFPHIGLVWAGNRHYNKDTERSINFSALQNLLQQNTKHFVSLQKDRPEDSAALTASDIFDAAPLLENFADTAAIICELDLVITVDTAVAHLAGALGKPVFILLAFDSDWRWMLGREDSPWYKTVRLFRQKSPGDWAPVIKSVNDAVHAFVAGDKSILQAQAWNGPCLHKNPYALDLPELSDN